MSPEGLDLQLGAIEFPPLLIKDPVYLLLSWLMQPYTGHLDLTRTTLIADWNGPTALWSTLSATSRDTLPASRRLHQKQNWAHGCFSVLEAPVAARSPGPPRKGLAQGQEPVRALHKVLDAWAGSMKVESGA